MNELKVLDEVLHILNVATGEHPLDKEYLFTLNEIVKPVSNRDRKIIMDMLIIDGYAGMLIDSMGLDKYFITYKGVIFINDGGYLHEKEVRDRAYARQESDRKITLRNDKILSYGTVIAGIAAACLLILQILQHFHHVCHWR